MNKIILIFLTIILALTMTACGSQSSEENTQKTTNDLKKEVQEAIEEATTNAEKKETSDGEKIKISTDKGNIIVQLEDNSATKDLLVRLPLMLQFENYNDTEKIAYLDTQLDTSDAPDKCTPKSGDLAYYAPWGNLAFFYQNFRESPELVPLGKIIEGKEYLDNIEQSDSVTIEQY